MKLGQNGCCVGRPRAFDSEKALEMALEVFWRKGYDGTSLADLTDAMGINKPSLYAAFGNKEQLFLKAVERYENRPCSFFNDALEQETAYAVAKKLLYGAAEDFANSNRPNGCVMVQGALSCSDSAESVKEALINKRLVNEARIAKRFAQAKDSGDLPTDSDPDVLARYIGTVLQGMTVQVTNGSDNEQLKEIANMALMAFPKSV